MLNKRLSQRHVLLLEFVALASMVIDHAARSNIYKMPGWEIVGRLAFPLFAITFASNVVAYKKCNIKKFIFIGIISLPGTYLLFGDPPWAGNAMFAFPLGWYCHKVFSDPTGINSVKLIIRQALLAILIIAFSLGPNYDVRGISLIACLIAYFSATTTRAAICFAVISYISFALTLSSIETLVSVSFLLLVIIQLVMHTRDSVVTRKNSVWGKLGFGKWYPIHLYALVVIRAAKAGI